MSARNAAQVAIEAIFDGAKAAAGLDDLAGGADKLERASKAIDSSMRNIQGGVDSVDGSTRKARRSVEDMAASTDNLGSKAGTATGALGALSSGFELVGLPGYAEGLMQVSMATDFLSGVGDSLTLVLESQALVQAKAKVAAIATGVAQRAQAAGTYVLTAATNAQAAATRVLNAALRANPIGLVITAILLLVAGFVLLYKRSETFRAIVQAVMRAALVAVGWVVDGIRALIGWIAQKAPAAWQTLKAIALTVWNVITAPTRLYIEVIKNVIGWVKDKLPAGLNFLKEKGVAAFNALISPVRSVIDWVDRLLGKIRSIHIPSLGDIGGAIGGVFGFAGAAPAPGSPSLMGARSLTGAPALAGGSTGGAYGFRGGQAPVQIIVQGALDPDAVARQIETILGRRATRLGRKG